MNGRNNIKAQYSNFTQESSSREKAAKKRELDRAYYLQNREKKIAQVKQRRQEKGELPTRPPTTRRELKRNQERDQIKEKRWSIRDSVQAKRVLIRE